MKVHVLAVLATALVIANLILQGDCFVGPFPSGKRDFDGKVWRIFPFVTNFTMHANSTFLLLSLLSLFSFK